MHEPPFSPTAVSYSENYHIESNPERHDRSPLVTDLEERVLKLCTC
ncbi:replication initiation protein [Raoultella planticola]|nr:replication initiation protein [Raoultella planticola]